MASAATIGPEVDRSLLCVGCGYDLRTQPMDGRCPECGLGVQLTVTLGAELAATRPGYAHRLAWASAMLLWARVVAFGTVMVSVASRHRDHRVLWGFLAAVLLLVAGSWLLCAREHPHVPPRLVWTMRAMRVLAAVIGILLVPLILEYAIGTYWLRPWVSSTALAWGGVAGGVLYLLCPALEMRIMVDLNRRIAGAELGRRAVAAGVAAGVAGLTICLVELLPLGMAWYDVATYTTAALVCVMLTGWLWTAWNCLLACRIFARAGRDAAARWKQQSGAAA